MKAFLRNILHILVWQLKFENETRLLKSQVLNRVENFVRGNHNCSGYFYRMSGRFLVKEHYFRTFSFGGSRNSFAPVAAGKVLENKSGTTVTILLRPNRLVQVLIVPIFWMACLTVFFAPFAFLFQYIVFV